MNDRSMITLSQKTKKAILFMAFIAYGYRLKCANLNADLAFAGEALTNN